MVSTPMKLTELNDLIDEFLQWKPLKPNSKRAYKTDLFYFAQFFAAEKFVLKELNKDKLLTWLKIYPDRAANRRGTNIRKFLLWLADEKQFEISPEFRLPWQFKDPTPKNPDRAVELSEEEFNHLIRASELNTQRKVLLGLVLTTGANLEELAVIRWKDLNLGRLPHLAIGESGKARVISLEEEVAELLRNLKKQNLVKDDEEFVFLTEQDGEPISSSYLAILVKRSTEKLLGKRLSPTQLHEYAKKRLLQRFSQVEIVMEMLGRKKAVSLFRVDESKIELAELKRIHSLAFDGSA